MTERDFDHIANFAKDQCQQVSSHRIESSSTRILFLSDANAIIEIRYTKKIPSPSETVRGPIDKIGL